MNESVTAVPRQAASTIHGAVLLLAAVLPVMAIVSLVPVIPLLGKEFSAVPGSEFLVPMAVTIPALCVALFSPLAGWLSDRVGRKLLLIIALLLYAVFGVLPYFMSDLMRIIISRVGLGVTEAVIMTVATAMLGDYFQGEERKRWIALQVALLSLAAIVLITVGGVLGETLGSRGPFLLYLIALPVALIVTLVLFEPEVREQHTEAEIDEKFPFTKVLPLVVITFVAAVLFYTIVVELGALLTVIGVTSPAVIGAVGAGVNFGHVTGSFIFHRLKSWSGPALLVVGFGIAAAGYLSIGLSHNLPTRAASTFFASVGVGVLLPSLLAWIMRELPAQFRGRGTGFWTGTFFLGQFVAPIMAVVLSDQLGGDLINVVFLYSLLAAAVALISVIFARRQAVGHA